MDKEFEFAAKNWINQYSADINSKVENLLNENDATPEELAEEINVDVEEIYDILDGNAENISVDTLIRIFMVLGFAIEIKPIEDTPLEAYNNVNPHVLREPQPSPFTKPIGCCGKHEHCGRHEHFGMPMPPHGFDPQNIPPHIREKIERELGINHEEPHARPQRPMHSERPMPRQEERPSSPFAVMGRDELVKIITKHLWDSEIDIENAPKTALVRFLEEKDKRMQAIKRETNSPRVERNDEKRMEELENDPKVMDFINKMKGTYKNNPQFRSYVNSFLGKLAEEE